MKPLLPLLLLLASPAYADAMPDGTTPDHGRHRPATSETPAWRPDGTRVTGPGIIGQPRPGAPVATGGGPVRIDGAGTAYRPGDVGLGFLPVPLYVAGATNYRRSGGGLVQVFEPDLDGPLPTGPIASAVAAMPTNRPPGGGGNPNTPDNPKPSVPGPVPILGLGAAFAFSRRLRRRITNAPRHCKP